MRCRHKNIYDMRSALRWAGQIASALSALHEQQPAYVHNDVKADNVFLTDAPRFLDVEDAKLGDLKPHRWVWKDRALQAPGGWGCWPVRISLKKRQGKGAAEGE
jgi:serine/threonine protein kinase